MNHPNLLLIDHDPSTIQSLAVALEPEGYELAVAVNTTQAINILEEDEQVDLILADYATLGDQAQMFCQMIQNRSNFQMIPILLLRDNRSEIELESILNLGVDDHIGKPFNTTELRRRIKTLLDLKNTREALGRTKEELQLTQEHLQGVLEQLEMASRTDLLTGLCNRKLAMEKLDEESVRSARNNRSFSLILCDIDHFHLINDECGSDVGDFLLRALASYFRNAIRRQDTIARWGGEEFLFILPETDALGAKILSEKIRTKLESFSLSHIQHKLNVTCSFGVMAFEVNQNPILNLRLLDEALWESKRAGGNCVTTVKPKALRQ